VILNLRSKILLMFGILMLFGVGNFIILKLEEENAAEQLRWVLHTQTVMAESESLLGFMRDAETGQRGFLLTEEASYLEPYTIGVAKAGSKLDLIRQLTSDNPLQQTRLDTIQSLMTQKTAELADTIRLVQQGKRNEALIIVKSDVGKNVMDTLRTHMTAFRAEEGRLLGIRNQTFVDNQDKRNFLFYGEALALLVLILGTGLYLQRTLVRPILALTNNAQKLAAGEEIENVSTSATDEMGELTKAFTYMHDEVRDRTYHLQRQAHFDQSFSQVVSACSSSRNLDKALSDALSIHSQHHESPVSAIYLFDDETGMLHCTIRHGTSDDITDTVSPGSGLVGQVYQSNESLVVGAASAEGFHIDAGLAELPPRAVILQPISIVDVTIGVLVMAYTVDPTDRDLHYITNLAHQFAITIMGARQYELLETLSEELEESRRELEIQRDEAVVKSITDPLTGLHNRAFMQIELEQLIQSSSRYDRAFSLIILDIDHFKKVNDTLGHQAGDEVLKAMAAALERETRSSDMVVRYGGEEFVIIMPETTMDAAEGTANKLRKVVAETDIPAMIGKNITISLGISRFEIGDTIDSIIARADDALYRAKEEGRDRVCLAEAS
jgi:diguanylate cyclase (GGDEF)-like protein